MAKDFGCLRCWPPTAEAAWEARARLTPFTTLVDESHYAVRILVCPHCTQDFVSVFTEIVDWTSGSDSQFSTLLPVTKAEADALVQRGVAPTEGELEALGPERRCLQHDFPRSAEVPRNVWGAGISIGLHD
jgi:hypothetical protein